MPELLIGLTLVVLLGVFGHWLAWSIRAPSILVLLIVGILAGPATGILDPDAFMGDLLFPVVSASVAVILFEGGLGLKFSDIEDYSGDLLRIVCIGVVVSWGLTAFFAWYVLDLPVPMSVLLGAILVVTGPTVIIPMLRSIRPEKSIGAVAKWEGIINDPVGAVLAVLVFEGILAGGLGEATLATASGAFWTLVAGIGVGGCAAIVLVFVMGRYWTPDHLENPIVLAIVLATFTLSNVLQPESGLVSVTLMGVILANQNHVTVGRIIEFKENLRVLLIAVLFILLAARLDLDSLRLLDWRSAVFFALLVLVIRPAAIFLSTIGSDFDWKQRVFLSWLAPRGIVAAAVASIVAHDLGMIGVEGAQRLVPEVFLVVMGTVALYGLTAGPLARKLGLAHPNPQGVLFVSAHDWAREIAEAVREQGLQVQLIDRNRANVRAARLAGLDAHHGSIVSGKLVEDIELEGIGKMIALTPNDEVNILGGVHFAHLFGRANVFQLRPRNAEVMEDDGLPEPSLRARRLLRAQLTFEDITAMFERGAEVRTTSLTEEFDYEDYRARPERIIMLFCIRDGMLLVSSEDMQFTPRPGDTVISLVESVDGGRVTPDPSRDIASGLAELSDVEERTRQSNGS